MRDKQAMAEAIGSVLKSMHATSSDIEASAVMSRDGHSLATVLGEGINPVRLGAICATLTTLGEKTSQEFKRGDLKQIVIQGDKGYVLLLRVGRSAVLAVVSRPGANLGMILVEARRTSNSILSLEIL